ncbi:MAG: hypothetical protein AAF491_07200, partial [Verrucomicrobiota bacterium]
AQPSERVKSILATGDEAFIRSVLNLKPTEDKDAIKTFLKEGDTRRPDESDEDYEARLDTLKRLQDLGYRITKEETFELKLAEVKTEG